MYKIDQDSESDQAYQKLNTHPLNWSITAGRIIAGYKLKIK